MTQEIARRLVDGEWVTDVEAQGGGGGGGGSQPVWEAVTVPTDAASWSALDTPGTVTADVPPTLPLTIIAATNDTFVIISNAPAPATETFTIPSGIYTTIAQTIAAMAAATGDDSGERFDTRITPSNSSGSILLTTGAHTGGVYALIQEGNGGAAALGFTGNPDVFMGGNGGDWLFTNGVISAPPAGGSNVICTTGDEFGQAWAVEAEVMASDHTNYQVAFNAAAWLYQADQSQELDGSGFQAKSNGPAIDSVLYGQGLSPQNTAGLPDENWHTIRAINLPLVQLVYLDGVLISQAFVPPSAYGPDGFKESRFLLFSRNGDSPSSFRNLKAWRIPLPTFSA